MSNTSTLPMSLPSPLRLHDAKQQLKGLCDAAANLFQQDKSVSVREEYRFNCILTIKVKLEVYAKLLLSISLILKLVRKKKKK